MNAHRFLSVCLLSLCCGAAHASLLALPPVDIEATLAADAAKPGPQPYRFAVPVSVSVTPTSHGVWTTGADGMDSWQLRIQSAGAASLNLGMPVFRLPPGAQLSLHDASGKAVYGPFGPGSATADGQLWTPIIPGDVVELHLQVPSDHRDAVKLQLSRVNHGFRGFGASDEYAQRSGDCNVDVVCPAGDEWRDEIRSVARFSIAGALLCSGQMVNNTAGDFRPYFLTANHCVTAPVLAPTLVFYWNYETSSCGGSPDGSLTQTSSGASFVAGSYGSTDYGPDFTLLELDQTPPDSYGVYWSGWDNRDIAPEGVTTIHHPSGDEKRISHFFGQTEITAYLEEPGQPDLLGQTDTHLRIADWDVGTTEGGSSGSGLWNAEHRLVGQLSGGYASCTSATADWYGRFHVNWYGLPTPLTSLATYLDPLGTGAEFVDGADPSADASVARAGNTMAPAATSGGQGGAFGPMLLLALCFSRRLLRRTR